jgi:AraC-like DNA-binding protein
MACGCGYEGCYEVSCWGRVRSVHPTRGKMLKPTFDRGYIRVSLCKNAQPFSISVHKIVAAAFIGPRPTPAHVINHIDAVKSNNHPENLEYVTKAENEQHAVRLGLKARGERHGESKLTDLQRAAIRREHRAGLSIIRLAAVTGMSERQISRIVRTEVGRVA